MKKTQINFKDLKGTLSRDEMKTIKGGDAVTCTECNGLDAGSCWARYCQSPRCWMHSDGEHTYLCQCVGDC